MRLSEIVNGRRPVTPDTALRLARATKMPASFWLALHEDWDLWHGQRSDAASEIERIRPLAGIWETGHPVSRPHHP